MKRISPKERFLNKVKVQENGCHEWQSTIHRDGYGKFWFDGKQIQAHRMSYSLFVGDIPDGLFVLHKCDNRKCVNPEHLYLGTASDNCKDKVERYKGMWGRMKIPYEDVIKCREMYYKLGKTQQEIANHFGIHQTQVSRYIRNKQRKE